MTDQHLIIIGFMGSGKTTVARKLGAQLNRPPVDLDEMITRSEGRSPGQIIEQEGEAEFRRIETTLLREVLGNQTSSIIAVGGGAWTIDENRQLIDERGAITVWLDVPFELCWKRIEAGGELRPLAHSCELAEELYLQRRPVYQLAKTKISVREGESATDIAMRVSDAISRLQ